MQVVELPARMNTRYERKQGTCNLSGAGLGEIVTQVASIEICTSQLTREIHLCLDAERPRTM